MGLWPFSSTKQTSSQPPPLPERPSHFKDVSALSVGFHNKVKAFFDERLQRELDETRGNDVGTTMILRQQKIIEQMERFEKQFLSIAEITVNNALEEIKKADYWYLRGFDMSTQTNLETCLKDINDMRDIMRETKQRIITDMKKTKNLLERIQRHDTIATELYSKLKLKAGKIEIMLQVWKRTVDAAYLKAGQR